MMQWEVSRHDLGDALEDLLLTFNEDTHDDPLTARCKTRRRARSLASAVD